MSKEKEEKKTKKTETNEIKNSEIDNRLSAVKEMRNRRRNRPIILEKIIEKEVEKPSEPKKKSIWPKIGISLIAATILYLILRPKNERN